MPGKSWYGSVVQSTPVKSPVSSFNKYDEHWELHVQAVYIVSDKRSQLSAQLAPIARMINVYGYGRALVQFCPRLSNMYFKSICPDADSGKW